MRVEEYRSAIELLLSMWSDSEHDACACMGPREGSDLCPCEERRVTVEYMQEALIFLPPHPSKQ